MCFWSVVLHRMYTICRTALVSLLMTSLINQKTSFPCYSVSTIYFSQCCQFYLNAYKYVVLNYKYNTTLTTDRRIKFARFILGSILVTVGNNPFFLVSFSMILNKSRFQNGDCLFWNSFDNDSMLPHFMQANFYTNRSKQQYAFGSRLCPPWWPWQQ